MPRFYLDIDPKAQTFWSASEKTDSGRANCWRNVGESSYKGSIHGIDIENSTLSTLITIKGQTKPCKELITFLNSPMCQIQNRVKQDQDGYTTLQVNFSQMKFSENFIRLLSAINIIETLPTTLIDHLFKIYDLNYLDECQKLILFKLSQGYTVRGYKPDVFDDVLMIASQSTSACLMLIIAEFCVRHAFTAQALKAATLGIELSKACRKSFYPVPEKVKQKLYFIAGSSTRLASEGEFKSREDSLKAAEERQKTALKYLLFAGETKSAAEERRQLFNRLCQTDGLPPKDQVIIRSHSHLDESLFNIIQRIKSLNSEIARQEALLKEKEALLSQDKDKIGEAFEKKKQEIASLRTELELLEKQYKEALENIEKSKLATQSVKNELEKSASANLELKQQKEKVETESTAAIQKLGEENEKLQEQLTSAMQAIQNSSEELESRAIALKEANETIEKLESSVPEVQAIPDFSGDSSDLVPLSTPAQRAILNLLKAKAVASRDDVLNLDSQKPKRRASYSL